MGGGEIGNGSAATLANEVQWQDVGTQLQFFGDVAGESWAKISGAGADDDSIDFFGGVSGIVQGISRCLCGESGGVFRKASLQGVGVQLKGVGERVKSEMAGGDSVFRLQDFSQDGLGPGSQL